MARSFLPVSAMEMPRFSGLPTFMRLPFIDPAGPELGDVQIGFVGVPFDGGTTNRPGARHGPRQLRDLSTMIRLMHPVTGMNPFATARCADVGDVSINPSDLMESLKRITAFYDRVVAKGVRPMTAGGDHLISLPILRALAKAQPLAMIHFDSHTDLWDSYFGGCKYTHGTPFRRAVEEGLLIPEKVIQIGIRGTLASTDDRDFARERGIRIVTIEELKERGLKSVMAEARQIVGRTPVYVSFDIDGIDPAFAPGTGTPEIGGFSTFEAQAMVRELSGLDIRGCDLVEVAPPFDPSGNTAFVGVSMMFEMLCPLAEAVAQAGRGG